MSLFQDFGIHMTADGEESTRLAVTRPLLLRQSSSSRSNFNDSDSDSSSSSDDEGAVVARAKGPVVMRKGAPPPPEDSGSDEDEADPDALNSPLSYVGIMGHTVRPFRGAPDSWTVYEAFSMVVPQRMLAAAKRSGMPVPQANQGGDEMTWGAFVHGDAQAEATKRLLFLMLNAVHNAISSETGDPQHLPPPGATAKTKRSIEQKAKTAIATNPSGAVAKRPRGVAGAAVGDPTSFLARMQQNMLTPPVSGPRKLAVWALPSQTRGVFILKTAQADHLFLARRISIVLEELVSPSARTIGWRWWFLVHDPRISLPQWITRIVEDNQACHKMRLDKIRKSKEAAIRPSSHDPRTGGAIDSPECHQAIRDVKSYARAVREYWLAMGCAPNATPCADNHAMARGIAAPSTSLHPARVFSPQVTMEIEWVCKNVCAPQRNIQGYVGLDTSLLGNAFPRPSRTIAYDPAMMAPEAVHEMALPEPHPERGKILKDLVWGEIERCCDRGGALDAAGGEREALPADFIAAVKNKNMEEITRVMDDLRASDNAGFDPNRFMKMVRNSVSEDLVEMMEGAAYAREAEGRREAAHRSKRRRVGDSDEEDPFGMELSPPDEEDASMADAADVGYNERVGGALALGMDEAMRGVPPPAMSEERQFNHLMESEEPGSRLSLDLVRRCPLLYLRMQHNTRLMQIEEAHEMGTPAYRVTMENFRSQAVANFVTMIMTNLDNEEMLSKPLRHGIKFLLGLNQRPNYIRRHVEWLQARRRARNAAPDDSPEAAKHFFLNTLQHDAGDETSGSEPPPAAEPSLSCHGLWHEWPAFGALNHSAYFNWRLSMGNKAAYFFRCKPGEESTNLLHRLMIMQGTAWWYHWGMHGDQLLWGPGGVGKSYLFDCLRVQAFAGQIESADNLTPKWCAVGATYPLGDVLMIIEEAPPRVVGQDEKGNPGPGDELLKTLLTAHFIETIEPYIDKDTKRRTMMRSQAMIHVTFYVATNLVIKKMPNGDEPPMLRRFMKSHVTLPSKNGISLSKINNPLSSENQTQEQTEFFAQLKVTNALCMLVEKLIMVKAIKDVNTDVFKIHGSWFFDEVARVCKVPAATMSNRAHLEAACRQTAIRYAVHKVFFTELAAKGIRCRPKNAHASVPEDWVPARFDFKDLLRVEPHLVVTEEMVIDVLTTMRTTYIPTTSWRVMRCLKGIVQKTRPAYRRVTQSTLWLQQNEDRDGDEPDALEGVTSSDSESSDSESSDDDGLGATNDAVLIRNNRHRSGKSRRHSDGQKVCSDKNYYAFQYPSVAAGLDYFTSQTETGLDRDVFYQVLIRQLSHELISHTDRNRPKREEDAATGQSRVVLDPETRKPVYDKVIQSPIVVTERAPVEDGGDHDQHGHGAYGASAPVQICILIEYLEQDRQDSLNDIIKKGFSYRGGRQREVLTACGTQERIRVKESGSVDRAETAVAIDYMGTVLLEDNPQNRLVRINHFPETRATHAFVNNQSLYPPDQSGENLRSRVSIGIDGYLDKIIIDHHLNYCGLPVSEEYYPWVHTQKLRDIAMAKKDPIGVPTSGCYRNQYPQDFRGVYQQPIQDPDPPADEDAETSTTTTETGEPARLFTAYLRQSRRKRQRDDF